MVLGIRDILIMFCRPVATHGFVWEQRLGNSAFKLYTPDETHTTHLYYRQQESSSVIHSLLLTVLHSIHKNYAFDQIIESIIRKSSSRSTVNLFRFLVSSVICYQKGRGNLRKNETLLYQLSWLQQSSRSILQKGNSFSFQVCNKLFILGQCDPQYVLLVEIVLDRRRNNYNTRIAPDK